MTRSLTTLTDLVAVVRQAVDARTGWTDTAELVVPNDAFGTPNGAVGLFTAQALSRCELATVHTGGCRGEGRLQCAGSTEGVPHQITNSGKSREIGPDRGFCGVMKGPFSPPDGMKVPFITPSP